MRRALLSIALLAGCGTWKSAAVDFGTVSKEVTDQGAKITRVHLLERADACEDLAGDRERLDRCLGPVASKPDHIDAVFESVRSAQLSLYLAVAAGDRAAAMAALADLQTSLAEAARLVKAAKEHSS